MVSITKQEALAIARKECEQRGWLWNEQTTVRWGFFTYTVWGGGRKGGNLWVRIRKKDGVVLGIGITPR
jgi:hypothetical protein